jgi:CheY-like chemotaxis protein
MPRRFLLVELNTQGFALMERTLSRRFPGAELHNFVDGREAAQRLSEGQFDAVIVHRAIAMEGVEVVRELRAINGQIPIVMMSSVNRAAAATEAGATTFLPYDAWLLLGTVLDELLRTTVSKDVGR